MRPSIRTTSLSTLSFILLFLSACGNQAVPLSTPTVALSLSTKVTVTQIVPTASITFEAIEKDTFSKPTATPTSSPTPTPTPFPIPPITPVASSTIAPHPLALTASNILQMQRLSRIGKGAATDVAWSPDNRYLAIAGGLGVFLYNAETLEQERLIETDYPVRFLAFSPDGKQLAVAGVNQISTWDVASGQFIANMEEEIPGRIWDMVHGANQRVAAIGSDCVGGGDCNQVLKIWDANSGKLQSQVDDIYPQNTYLSTNRNGALLLFSNGSSLEVRNLTNNSVAANYLQLTSNVIIGEGSIEAYGLLSIDDPPSLVFQSNGKISNLKETLTCSYLSRTEFHGMCFSETTIVLFDLSTGQQTASLNLAYANEQISPSVDGRRLAKIHQGMVSILDIESGHTIRDFDFDTITSFTLGAFTTADGLQYVVATGNTQGQIKVHNLISGELIHILHMDEAKIESLATSPDHRTVVAFSSGGIARLWDLQEGKLIAQYRTQPESEGPAVFSPDGLLLTLIDSHQEAIREFDLHTTEMQFLGRESGLYSYGTKLGYTPFFYTPQGSLVTWDFQPDKLNLIDLHSKEAVVTLPYETISDYDFIESVALSANGRYLAAGNVGSQIFVWDLETQEKPRVLFGHESLSGDGWAGSIRHLFFSPQSDLLVSIGWDGTTRLWDIATEQQLRQLNNCCLAGFSADGRFLVTISNSAIRVWGIPTYP